jgi:hypothetical protein
MPLLPSNISFALAVAGLALLSVAHGGLVHAQSATFPVSISARVSPARPVAGFTVTAIVHVKTADTGIPVSGYPVCAYVDQKRWGADCLTDDTGNANLLLPLPNTGMHQIVFATDFDSVAKPLPASWIWSSQVTNNQHVRFTRSIILAAEPSSADLWMTCDNSFTCKINDKVVAAGANYQDVQHADLTGVLHAGNNVIDVDCKGLSGPAGLLGAVLYNLGPNETHTVPTDKTWTVADTTAPASSPAPAIEEAPAGGGPWGSKIANWPGMAVADMFPIGKPMPEKPGPNAVITMNVLPAAPAPVQNPAQTVVMRWEPWFTPDNVTWSAAEAVPVLGQYRSTDTDVIRQHVLWMNQLGVDSILVDFTNNTPTAAHWSEHGTSVDEMIESVTALADTLAKMRSEKLSVPHLILMTGTGNGSSATLAGLNEELKFIYETYVKPSRYSDLWVRYQGKPLMVVLDTQGPDVINNQPPIDNSQFTIRFMTAQLQGNHDEQAGYWSLMDGSPHPVATNFNGSPEALTITPAFFGSGGWTDPQAVGRRGGATFVTQFADAIASKPRFLLINQWNEFESQADGHGLGPDHDIYVDAYSPSLSNDIEPTSPFLAGARGGTGWGYYYFNLTRALLKTYRGEDVQSTIVALAGMDDGDTVSGKTVHLEWSVAGKPPASYDILVDGNIAAEDLKAMSFDLPVSQLAAGAHRLSLIANGAVTRYGLALSHEDIDYPSPVPVVVKRQFEVGGN